VTEQARIDRETLLRRAVALAGGVYAAPAISSRAEAGVVCAGQACKSGKGGIKRCRKTGGKNCTCRDGRCGPIACRCTFNGCPCCLLQPCGAEGSNCGCFFGAGGGNPGVCIDLGSGLCADFEPCDNRECPRGHVCFTSCCPEPLCAPCCTEYASRRAERPRAGMSDGPRLYLTGGPG
jgi:hypothetical protein